MPRDGKFQQENNEAHEDLPLAEITDHRLNRVAVLIRIVTIAHF
jgi:hypothetical protein